MTDKPEINSDAEKLSQNLCELCGDPMPPGEEMFRFHGYSGPCPKPLLPSPAPANAGEVVISYKLLQRCYENMQSADVDDDLLREVKDILDGKSKKRRLLWPFPSKAYPR